MSKIAVIGAGPAGVMAAITAATNGHDVTVYEQNEKIGKKLFLTGKGRCNFTNSADIEDFFARIPRNPKFLYSALYAFTNDQLIAYLNDLGLPTKVERGGRVFPLSDKSSDVLNILFKAMKKAGVTLFLNTKVIAIHKKSDAFIIKTQTEQSPFDKVIIATGGISYPSTGSDGKFFDIVKTFGHKITPLSASLIALNTYENVKELAGLTLKNVIASFYNKGKCIYQEMGELLFTHHGISGPLVLSASAFYDDIQEAYVVIDLKTALSEKTLDQRLLRDIESAPNKDFINFFKSYLPASLLIPFCRDLDFDTTIKANSITKQNRKDIIQKLKAYTLTIQSKDDISKAIITRGGVDIKCIDPSNMQSKLVEGLYFAGEMIDVDGLTGGYNLQIAFSTGYLAGLCV